MLHASNIKSASDHASTASGCNAEPLGDDTMEVQRRTGDADICQLQDYVHMRRRGVASCAARLDLWDGDDERWE